MRWGSKNGGNRLCAESPFTARIGCQEHAALCGSLEGAEQKPLVQGCDNGARPLPTEHRLLDGFVVACVGII